ncbi:hypothetical protein HYT56_00585 [Candidatus Woesearchaeota archaeon]|nr:hypothetical protein [Candidatus Woesearchaeota archaeon]
MLDAISRRADGELVFIPTPTLSMMSFCPDNPSVMFNHGAEIAVRFEISSMP